jgi:hypothetical protein
MAKATKEIKLTWSDARELWRKNVLKTTFYLGKDETRARDIAREIIRLGDVRRDAEGQWQEDDVPAIKLFIKTALRQRRLYPIEPGCLIGHIDLLKKGKWTNPTRRLREFWAKMQPEPSPVVDLPRTPASSEVSPPATLGATNRTRQASRPIRKRVATLPVANTMTLHEALDAFDLFIAGSKSRSDAWKATVAGRIKLIKDACKDMDLSDFDYDELLELADALLGRLKKLDWSMDHTKNLLATSRQAIDWMDTSSRIPWEAPRRWEKVYLDARKRVRALSVEKPEDSPDAPLGFTVEEITVLLQHANPKQRALMLLGINCGFTGQDIATLTTDNISIGDDDLVEITKPRTKTRAYGRWRLWPETAELLQAEIDRREPKRCEPIFMTRQGKPLVWRRKNGNRVDSVWQTFRKLLITAELKETGKSFKHLRKTGGQFVRDLSTEELMYRFLADKEQGVHKNYTKFTRWDALADVTDRVRNEILADALSAKPAPKPKTAKAKKKAKKAKAKKKVKKSKKAT